MMRFVALIFCALFLALVTVASSEAWLIYHKPEFKGKVIDAETKEPIEGVVVVVVYRKQAIRVGPESVSINIDIREVLTDRDGNFRIPSYTTLIDPLAWSKEVNFIIFKSGYGSFPNMRVYPPRGLDTSFEEFFSGDVGSVKEVWFSEPWKVGTESKKIEVAFGTVELPKVKTSDARWRALSTIDILVLSEDIPCRKKKNLARLFNEEYRKISGSNKKGVCDE